MKPGLGEILLILAIVLLLFGAKRLPALAEGLGKSIRSFKKSVSGDEEDHAAQKEPRSEEETPGAIDKPEREKERV